MPNLKSFIDFLSESDEVIDYVDSKFLLGNLEKLNAELETGTERPYRNAPIMLAQMRGILERYGIQLPQSAQTEFLNLGAQLVYHLTDSYKLYIVFDTNSEGYVEGYAQVATNEELQSVLNMKPENWMEKNPPKKRWIPPARKDDDSGNTNEY